MTYFLGFPFYLLCNSSIYADPWRVLARRHLDTLHSSNTAVKKLSLTLRCDHPIINELYCVDRPSKHDGKKIAQKKINNLSVL